MTDSESTNIMIYGGFIYRFVFEYIESNMYIIIEDDEALVIDPHYSQEAESLLNSNGIRKCTILLTHEHFDHTSGICWFRNNYETILICHKEALDEKSQYICNKPALLCMKLAYEGNEEESKRIEEEFPPYSYTADIDYEDELEIKWKGHDILFTSIPGHSPASSLIHVDDLSVFTGDSLIPNIEPTLRWPRSNPKEFKKSFETIKSISREACIYPGHGQPEMMANLYNQGYVFYTKE